MRDKLPGRGNARTADGSGGRARRGRHAHARTVARGPAGAVARACARMLGACAALGAGCAAPGDAWIEVGTGDQSLVLLQEGAELATYQGPQGGFHVFLGVRAGGVNPGTRDEPIASCTAGGPHRNPCIDLAVHDAVTGDALDAFSPLRVPLDPAEGDAWTLRPRLVVLAVSALAEMDGRTVVVRAHVEDAAGRRAETTVNATGRAVSSGP